MYITSQQSYLSQINTRQTSFEAYFDSNRKSRDSIAPSSVTVIYKRQFKKLFTVIFTGKLTNRSWHLYRKCFVVSLDIGDFTFIAHAQKRQPERFSRPEKCKRNMALNTKPLASLCFGCVFNRPIKTPSLEVPKNL